MVNVVAPTPRSAHGDTEAKPSPDPNANKINVVAMATKAPAMMAPQDAAAFGRDVLKASPMSVACGSSVRSMMVAGYRCEHMASNKMTGRGTPSIQRSIPRPMMIPLVSSEHDARCW
jgi:hypothetical protein